MAGSEPSHLGFGRRLDVAAGVRRFLSVHRNGSPLLSALEHPILESWVRHMKTVVTATVAVLAALAAGPATASVVAESAGTAECVRQGSSAGGQARVRAGSHTHDINDVTRVQQHRLEARLHRRLQARGIKSSAAAAPGSITVPVRVHIIVRDDGTGGVTREQVNQQIRVVNDGYAGATSGAAAATPFVFDLRSIDRTRNTDWFHWTQADDDRPAKRALHRGGYNVLNLYVAQLGGGLLGYAYFPGVALARDGVVLLNESLPGGSASPYNKGDTATHEIGHWLGLYHTFQNGCAAPGDAVGDTPRQDNGENIYSCNESLDTCGAPGRDPVHNFMSYGTDICLDRFTAGQADRMLSQWQAFRAS